MASEIYKTTTYDCLRNLQYPKSTTAWEGKHPDTYHGEYWNFTNEPHCNSTVLSHWFYLLVQGSGGNGYNDNNDPYNVTGIGINYAQQIAYNAEVNYLNSSADYNAAKNATIQASIDLYGPTSQQTQSVIDAWGAVGVG